MKKMMLLFVAALSLIGAANAQKLEVNITDIKNNKGQFVIKVYDTSEARNKEAPVLLKEFSKTDVKDGILSLKLDLKYGTYGLSLLDDENADGEMEKSFIGMPKEGFGYSDFYLTKLNKPAWEDFVFKFSPEKTSVTVRVKYL